jgi:small ligand-binding sensory domain FIST
LNIGSITAGYVLKSAEVLSHAVKNAGEGEGLFIFSCFSRIVALGGDPMAEIKVIQKELAGFPVPYLFFYSGGEICPVYISQGQMANQFYQYALVACLF